MEGHLVRPYDFLTGGPVPGRIQGWEGEYDIQFPGEKTIVGGEIVIARKDSLLLRTTAFKRAGIITFHHGINHWLTNGGNFHLDVGLVESSSGELITPSEMAANKVGTTRRIGALTATVKGAEAHLHAGTTIGTSTRSTGFHDNSMLPYTVADNARGIMPRLLDSFDATRIASWGGRVGTHGFELSQKARSIGEPTTYAVGSRTAEGSKPMGWIKMGDFDVFGGSDRDRWARSERRVVDPLFSRVATFISACTDSLMLRLIEHRRTLPRKMPLGKLMLQDPLSNLHEVSTDITLKKIYPTIDKNYTVTALNLQELYNDYFNQIATEVELPADELEGIVLHRKVYDRLGKLDMPNGGLESAIGWVDWVAHFAFLRRRIPPKDIRASNAEAVQRSIVWDTVQPEGPAMTYWNYLYDTGQAPDPLGDDLITYMQKYPSPHTRAAVRGNLVRNHSTRGRLQAVDWKAIKIDDEVHILHPYQTELSPTSSGQLTPRHPLPKIPTAKHIKNPTLNV
ncbi:MAG TPA: proteasome accessory factor PafA2 family protein [Candidatus Saccharimonadales bacterium]|nr:proteasome accessory factor PafA2 family protein [Candidatus Saccharimonadales bacterium]